MRALKIETELNSVVAGRMADKLTRGNRFIDRRKPNANEAAPWRGKWAGEQFEHACDRRRARKEGKVVCLTAVRNDGLLNPQLADSVDTPTAMAYTQMFLPEVRRVAYSEYVSNPRGVYFSDGGYMDDYYLGNSDWKNYQDEEAAASAKALEEELLSGWDDEFHSSDSEDDFDTDGFECGRQVHAQFHDSDWDDVVADGYDPEAKETTYHGMGTCPKDWHQKTTVDGVQYNAMPVVLTHSKPQAVHCAGQSFGSAHGSNAKPLGKRARDNGYFSRRA